MSEQSVIVWDLETVPDLKAVARMFGLEESDEAAAREALGTGFPKHPLHRIACIGALIAKREENGWRVSALGAPHVEERPEPELIKSFVDRIGELKPQLVTFNGNGFDLPVLRYRAMINRVPAPGLHARSYFNRYTNDAIDLCDVLGSFGASGKMKLDDICRILGLAGKPEGIDGSKVEETIAAGRIDEVARYCETDVVNTYRLWLIHELFRGAITFEEMRWSERQLVDYVRQHKLANPHLQAAMDLMEP
jgi:predicted PolB exonuclease-like 3'-5' exonuclease